MEIVFRNLSKYSKHKQHLVFLFHKGLIFVQKRKQKSSNFSKEGFNLVDLGKGKKKMDIVMFICIDFIILKLSKTAII